MADTNNFSQSDYNAYNATALGIGGAASLGSGIANYFALQSQGTFQLRMAEINQQLANAQADMVYRNGVLASDKIRQRGAANVGSQRAAEAAQGLDVNDSNSSGADLQSDTRDATQSDISTTRTNAWLQAYGIKANAQNAVNSAQVSKIGSNFAAGQTLLGGALGGVQAGFKIGGGMFAGPKDPKLDWTTDTNNLLSVSKPDLGDSFFGKDASGDGPKWQTFNPNKGEPSWLDGLFNGNEDR